MIDLVGLDIEINRGNAAGLTFHFEGEDVPKDGTSVVFMVRPARKYDYAIVKKEVPVVDASVTISFLPEDTNALEPGDYYWNACIQYANGLEPWTILKNWASFRILPG